MGAILPCFLFSDHWIILCKWSWFTLVTGMIYIGELLKLWKSNCFNCSVDGYKTRSCGIWKELFFLLKLKRFQKGLPALEWASWMGNPDGPPGEGNHLPGQVPSFFPAYHPWVQNFGILNIWSWFMMFNECQSGQSTSTRTTPSSSQCVHRQVRCCWTILGVRSANTGKTSRYTSSCDNRQSWQ